MQIEGIQIEINMFLFTQIIFKILATPQVVSVPFNIQLIYGVGSHLHAFAGRCVFATLLPFKILPLYLCSPPRRRRNSQQKGETIIHH